MHSELNLQSHSVLKYETYISTVKINPSYFCLQIKADPRNKNCHKRHFIRDLRYKSFTMSINQKDYKSVLQAIGDLGNCHKSYTE